MTNKIYYVKACEIDKAARPEFSSLFDNLLKLISFYVIILLNTIIKNKIRLN